MLCRNLLVIIPMSCELTTQSAWSNVFQKVRIVDISRFACGLEHHQKRRVMDNPKHLAKLEKRGAGLE
jgi:hypothetical protein